MTDENEQAVEDQNEERFELEVEVVEKSPCERHIKVTVPRKDIERYFDREFSELMPEAQVPGFRPGKAPRKIVEVRFRKEVGERVKNGLLLDAISQVNEDESLAAISEPDFDYESVELPDEGPMTFEFDLEVRPDFALPKWKGLKIERPSREFTDEDVDLALRRVLERDGTLIPSDDPAEMGDYITTKLTFTHDGEELTKSEGETIRIRPILSFHDGRIEDFGEKMTGVKAGDKVELKTKLTDDAPNAELRGKEVTAVFEVEEVKKLDMPELDAEYLEQLGDFESEADLRDAVLDMLKRQLEYDQHQRTREQVLSALTEAADWELPPALLERQSQRELQRAVLELRRSGFADQQIQAHINLLRQNSRQSTAKALKEHFVLERIAEEENIDAEDFEFELEMALIANQSGESVRRVRSRLEKQGGMDALRNQIVERKVIDLILKEADFADVAYEPETLDRTDYALDRSAGGGESEIPEAVDEHEEAEAGAESVETEDAAAEENADDEK